MAKIKILIVDDEAASSRLLKLNLEQTGRFEAKVINFPEDALKAALEFLPNLILLDVMMPRMFGGDVAALMQKEEVLKDVPIVYLSAAVTRERVREHEGLIHGMPFIAKPATVEEVIAMIDKQLGKTS